MAIIGSVGVSGQATNRGGPRLTTDFGAGIGRVLQGVAGELGQFQESAELLQDQYADKQNKAQRAEAEISWIKQQTALDQELAELSQERTANPGNFTNDYDAILEKRKEEFIAGLPENLRDEYRVRAEQFGRGLLNQAFGFENEAVNQVFLGEFTDVRNGLVDEVLQGVSSFEDIEPTLENLYDNSPLDARSTKELRKQTTQLIKKAELQTILLEELRTPELSSGTTGGPADGSDVVAAGLSGPNRALLNAIASTEAPAYNILHGGGTFDSFDQHPNKRVEIKSGPNKGKFSTAAGRYQFIYSTWKEAQAALQLPDFSPESQDRAAVWLAKRDYFDRTGRDIEADIGSGDPDILANIRATLGPTWEGLTKISDQDFAAMFTGDAVTGTASAIISDEKYQDIPYLERLEIMAAAQKQTTAEMKVASDARMAEQQTALNNMIAQIRSGATVSQVQVSEFANAQKLGIDDRDKLQKEFDVANETSLTVNSVTSKLSNPNYVFNKTGDRADVNVWAENTLIPQLNTGDPAVVESAVLPAISRLGFVPQNVSSLLTASSGSRDRRIANFALETLTKMRAINPTAFDNSFSQNSRAMSDTLFFERSRRLGMTDDQIWEELERRRDPQYLQTIQQFEKQAEANVSKTQERGGFSESFSATSLGEAIGVGKITDTQSFVGVFTDFKSHYINEFTRYRDHEAAYEAAAELVKTQWGRSEVNGGRIMKYPPERSVAVESRFGSFDWMGEELRNDLGLEEGTQVKLINDKHTQHDFQTGSAPRYQVAVETDGVFQPVMNPQNPGVPLIYQFETPEKVKSDKREQAVLDREISILEQKMLEIGSTTFNSSVPETRAKAQEEIKELMAQIAELRGQNIRPDEPGMASRFIEMLSSFGPQIRMADEEN